MRYVFVTVLSLGVMFAAKAHAGAEEQWIANGCAGQRDTAANYPTDGNKRALASCEERQRAKYREAQQRIERQNKEEADRRAAANVAREAQRKAYEEKRAAEKQAEAAAEAAEQARLDAIRADPKQMGFVFGGIFCAMKQLRDRSLAEIAKEKKYAGIGGYENKAKLYALQQKIRRADEITAQEQKNLKTLKRITPETCSSEQVKTLLLCRATPGTEGCDRQAIADMLTFVPSDEPESEE